MSRSDPDVIVIGSGPNGLVAAAVLAKKGLRVLVLESNAARPGGAVGSEEATLPGYVHDVGAAFFPFGTRSPAFLELGLERYGVEWCHAAVDSAHPAPDGSVACIARDLDLSARHFGSERDGDTLRRLATWHAQVEARVLGALMRPFPALREFAHIGVLDGLRLARLLLASGGGLARRLFETEAARRVMPGLALHVDVGPSDRLGAALGYMLGMTATTGGYPVPRGGAQVLADALVRLVEHHGGRVRLGQRVERIRVESGRAVAVELAGGDSIPARLAVFADTAAPRLLGGLVESHHLPARVVRKMRVFPSGWGAFKIDWALSGSVPWSSELARQSAVVHAGDSLDDLERFTVSVRRGELPDHPYLVVGQQSDVDPTRAPEGGRTLWAYSRVPARPAGGWTEHADRFADVVEQRIEGLAPGFRALVRARRVVTPADLELHNDNLIGGDLGGGSNAWHRQFIWRPVFPYFRYRMPIAGLYLCSSYAHPGAGVHGMCGHGAATVALRDIA